MNQSRPAVQAYVELMRLPNVFTAMADILLGFFFVYGESTGWSMLAVLLAASSCLYLAGMVLNDYFDRDIDALDRPRRPIPSGRILPSAAAWLGFRLLFLGVAFGWIASALAGDIRSGLIATLLAVAIVLYDGTLKNTPLGPIAMGSCRTLNVLLGMAVAVDPWSRVHFFVAVALGIYVAGVTWFARTEARRSSRAQLSLALCTMGGGIVLVAWFPEWMTATSRMHPTLSRDGWRLMMVVLGAMILWRGLVAVVDPSPTRVQQAVKHSIISLVFLDAAVCAAVRGPALATVVLLMLVPAVFLGRWIYST